MKKSSVGLMLLLLLPFLVTGCFKKATDQASLSTGAEFDSLTPTEELAQLPQAGVASQQAAVEVLPIETSPETQGLAAPTETIPSTPAGGSLSFNRKIQIALRNAGLYEGNVDGKIGPMTRKAIESFQRSNGLKVDGKVGPQTWKILEPYFQGQQAVAQSSAAVN